MGVKYRQHFERGSFQSGIIEQHIPFLHLTNKSKPSKIRNVDLHLAMSCRGILMAKYMELAYKKVCDLLTFKIKDLNH